MAGLPLAERVVEVVADLGPGVQPRFRYGSGCRVAGRTVLTAAHVVAGAGAVSVRSTDKTRYPATLDQVFVGGSGLHGAPDLALLRVADLPEVAAMPLAAVRRDGAGGDVVDRCLAVGYPEFAERTSSSGPVRDTVHAYGRIPVLSQLVSGLLTLHVSDSPRDLPPAGQPLAGSPWSGMSGAPVLADGYLVGVVTEHAPRAGASAISLTPLTALDRDAEHPGRGAGVPDPGAWWARLGAATPGGSGLPRLPRGRARVAPYRATIREIRSRTGSVVGRAAELAAIGEFATGPPGYRWVIGDAWAGKTSLLAEVVTAALPDGVDVVAYFLSRRETDADANRFLAAVIPQLSELLDEDPPTADLHEFRSLWERGSAAAAAAGRDLLLVVDGIDEDLRPPGTPSVAALLPASTPARAHVLVTSRPSPPLPVDVPAAHPLRVTRPHALEPFAGAHELAGLAVQEIEHLKGRDLDDLALDVLGVLTAAAGPLSVDDVAALTAAPGLPSPAHTRRVRRLLAHDAARSLQRVGPEPPRYHFAHGMLLEHAQADPDLSHPAYRTRIHRWARTWEEAGWPTAGGPAAPGTPRYLLGEYVTTLAREPARQRQLAGDVLWALAALQALGVDRVLAELQPAAQGAGCGTRADALFAAVRARAAHLRDPMEVQEPGSAARQLCLHALERDDPDLAETLTAHLRALPAPGPVPLWTTRRTSGALEFELARGVGVVAVLPDGRVVTGGGRGSDGSILVWDLARPGATPVELGRLGDAVRAIAVLSDGRLATGGRGGLMLAWDPARPGTTPVELGRHEDGVGAMAVLPDGRLVIGGSGGGGRVLVSDPTRPGAVPVELGRHEQGVRAMAVLPDGRPVTGDCRGGDGRVLVWDPARPGVAPIELSHDGQEVRAFAVLPDGRLVTGDCRVGDGRLLLWNLATPGRPVELGRDMQGVGAIAVLPDGRLVTGDVGFGGGRVLVWDPARPGAAPVEVGSHEEAVGLIAVLPDGRLVTGGHRFGRGRVLVWDLGRSGAAPVGLGRLRQEVRAVAVLPGGRLVTGGNRFGRGRVLVWDLTPSGAVPVGVGRLEQEVRAVAVLPDGRLVTGGDRFGGGRVLVWDLGRPDATSVELGRHEREVETIAVLPDGRLVTGGGGRLLLWDPAPTGGSPVELGGRHDDVGAIAVLPDGRLVTGGSGSTGRVLVRDPARPDAVPVELGRHERGVEAIAVLPDGRPVTGGGGRLLVWDPARAGATPTELRCHEQEVRTVAVLPGGRVAVVAGGRVGIQDLSTPTDGTWVACDARLVVAHGAPGDVDLIVLHDDGVTLSGWSVPSEPRGGGPQI